MSWPAPLRHAVRRLPEPAQLLLKRGRVALTRDDWASAVARLRVDEQALIDDITHRNGRLGSRKRILLFALQQVPPWLDVEYSLAAALRMRGHDLRGVLCDGILPSCEMNLGGIERPPCGVCAGWLTRYESAFGFDFERLKAFVSEADRVEAEELIDGTAPGDWLAIEIDGVDVGRLARRELQRSARGFVFEPQAHPGYRAWLLSALLLVRLAQRLLEREQPDVIIAGSGRTLPSACLAAIAQRRGIRVVTWDTEPTFTDGLVFSHEGAAPLLPLDGAWVTAATESLGEDQSRRLRQFMDVWAQSSSRQPHDAQRVDDDASIRRQLGLRAGARLIVAFTNSPWDVAAIDRDAGFANMFEWVFALVEWAAAHPQVDLVVRAHPAESHAAADLRSTTPVVDEIRKRFGSVLLRNIALVHGDSEISSYTLAAMADSAMTYASRIGLEIAVRGRRPWIAGDTAYRGRGFTRDLRSARHMVELLNASSVEDALTRQEVNLAERFAYLWFFRYVTRLPLLRPPNGAFSLESFRELAPGGNSVVDRICDAIVNGTMFIDLA